MPEGAREFLGSPFKFLINSARVASSDEVLQDPAGNVELWPSQITTASRPFPSFHQDVQDHEWEGLVGTIPGILAWTVDAKLEANPYKHVF